MIRPTPTMAKWRRFTRCATSAAMRDVAPTPILSEAPAGPRPVAATPVHYALLLCLAAMWGTSFLLIEIAIAGMSPLLLAATRVIAGAIVLGLIALWRGARIPRGRAVWVRLFLIGWLGNALPYFLISWGQQGVTSGLAAILMAVVPLFALVMSHWTTRDDRITTPKAVGISLGFLGVVLLIGPSALQGLGGALPHEAAVAAGALSYAITSQIARHLPPVDFAAAGAGALTVGGVTLALVAVATGAVPDPMPPLPALGAALTLGLFATGLATLIYFRLVTEAGATFTSMNNYLVPVIGVVLGAMLLGEVVSADMGLALGCILGGIAISRLPARWRRG